MTGIRTTRKKRAVRKPRVRTLIRLFKGRWDDPHIALCLSVFLLARLSNTQIWQDFIDEHNSNQTYSDAFDIALWVGDWWARDKAGKIKYSKSEPDDNKRTYK